MATEKHSELEIFLLAAVGKLNLPNVTILQKEAGVSIGAALPALKRLEKAGLVKGRAGERHKRDYKLTAEGEKALSECWQGALAVDPTELSAILRTYPLSRAMGDQPTAPAQYFLHAARHRKFMASKNQPEIDWLRVQLAKLPLLQQFRWIRLVCDQHRLQAEAEALENISNILESEGGQIDGR